MEREKDILTERDNGSRSTAGSVATPRGSGAPPRIFASRQLLTAAGNQVFDHCDFYHPAR